MKSLFNIYILIFTLILCSLYTLDARGQDFAGSGPMNFRERNSQAQPGTLTSNIVRIINNTGRISEFQLRISAPAGWQVLGTRERTFSLQPGDTIYVPTRIIPSIETQSPQPQSVNAMLFRFGSLVASADWMITPILRSEWTASIKRQRIILPGSSDTTSFNIRINNPGNLSEDLLLTFSLSPGIHITSAPGEETGRNNIPLQLSPGKDTTIVVYLKFRDEVQDKMLQYLQANRQNYRIRVQIAPRQQVAGTSKLWGTNVEIRKLAEQWKQNRSPYRSLPMSAEFTAYDVLQPNSYGALALYGSHIFEDASSLSYYFQSNFTSTFLNPQSFLGQYFNLNYVSEYFGAELGNISQNNEGANISGEGIKVWGNFQNHRLGIAYMNTPGVFEKEKNHNSLATEYNYQGKDINGGAYVQRRENFMQKTEEEIAGAFISYRFLNAQFIRLSAAASRQEHLWVPDSIFNIEGLGYTINYTGRYDKLSYNMMYSASTPSHLVRRGVKAFSARTSWRFSNRDNVFASFSENSSDPEYYYRGQLRELNLFRKRQIYRLGWQHRGELSDISLQPLHERFQDPWIHYNTSGIELDYRLIEFRDLRFFSGAFAGYTQLSAINAPDPVFVARLRASIRYYQYALNLRYYFGPYYANEMRRFAEDLISANRFSASINFDNYLLPELVLLRISSMYNYTTYNKQHSLSLRPEIYYFPQAGLRLGLYARYYALSTEREDFYAIPDMMPENAVYASSRLEFGFSIKKDLNIPISGKKYFDLSIVVFRDLGATGLKDNNDPGVPEVWVRLQAMEVVGEGAQLAVAGQIYEAITNKEGKAMFINIPPGSYLLSLIPVANASSRHETRTMEVLLGNDRTIYVSIDRGARVAGNITLDRDQFTRSDYFPLGGIRVTATHEDGQQFSTLTTEEGQYSLYLPRGNYRIAINENVFGQNFQLQQNNIPIEIIHQNEIVTINFIARERTRQIRIQQPGNDQQQSPPQPD